MTIRATLFVIVTGFATACGGAKQNKIMADTPALPYQAPDIAEITGIEEDDEDEATAQEAEPAAPAPAPAPAPAASPAAAPAPAPKAPAKSPAPATPKR
jgi:pyruvate dehydrogenase E2 component (dihydrolipoamide acetyltransferase)